MMALELETMFISQIYSWTPLVGEQLATLKNQITRKSPSTRGPPEVVHLHVSWDARINDSYEVDHTLLCELGCTILLRRELILVQAHLTSEFLWHKVYDTKYTSPS